MTRATSRQRIAKGQREGGAGGLSWRPGILDLPAERAWPDVLPVTEKLATGVARRSCRGLIAVHVKEGQGQATVFPPGPLLFRAASCYRPCLILPTTSPGGVSRAGGESGDDQGRRLHSRGGWPLLAVGRLASLIPAGFGCRP